MDANRMFGASVEQWLATLKERESRPAHAIA
jgi:hypothetical protein